ncbi:cytokinin riboside 5'-monophosphate phosphoribohydrolase [Longimycelium tulufanense]|uniref:Cytokinin riboside 5'-monophosphate phosphoribohydrolase n=1 Tax=Longimycelium tulufanense TaxID=907463 RepID=A0A8J3CD93_9PSEU|nr:TIGR00730 family Rossman fold protein [Longimycelium tulufanense]GGM42968.1 cytokinin riboside 5'-monophosphate phosphoribohydrolase [Longimycelium tulufanense]
MTTVCVYCASGRNVPERYLQLAREVGKAIAARGWDLVWGGGRVSMMGEVAREARAGGARTVGVIPQAMMTRELADQDADELLVVDNMRDRKALMDAHATAFLALPGGLGTLEELFEVWTSRFLAMHSRPVVVLDPDGHYDGLLAWIDELCERGFAYRSSLEALTVVGDIDSALDACAASDAS